MDKWIQNVHMKKGALHREMGVPEGDKIPAEKLEAASKKGGKIGRRARFAQELEGFKKKPSTDGMRRMHKVISEDDKD